MFNIAQRSEVNVRDRFARTFVRAILRRSDLGENSVTRPESCFPVTSILATAWTL
jgi:hypothetical protein